MMARHAREVSHFMKDHREEALRRDVKVTKDTNAYRRQLLRFHARGQV